MRRPWTAVAVLLILILPALLVACGDDEETTSPSPSPTPSGPDIVTTLEERGDFTTLLTALDAADLAETLRGPGPYTLFAPPDSAFAELSGGILDDLLADPAGALTGVLTYHVVSGKVMSTDLSDGMMVETVNGATLRVDIGADGAVRVNDATVMEADIEATNGVIHVIDGVLIPPETSSPAASPGATDTASPAAP